jgi:energy-coupling factor transport system ATP-binding protein
MEGYEMNNGNGIEINRSENSMQNHNSNIEIISQGLKFSYPPDNEGNTKVAIDGVDITINKGEFVVVLGHNGSGKSTFAKHINALLTPSDGKLFVSGFDTSKEENIWNVRSKAGMVFQNPDNQIVATIVEEDVAFGPENLGVAPEEIRRRVDESLKQVNMYKYKSHGPHLLSGGQKQRVAIAGILAMRPECIVLDEPTAMLDPSGRREVIKTITELNKKNGITIVLITHYMEEAVAADRIYVMDSGKVVLEGVPKDVFMQVETMKTLGLDVPQMTELAYELNKSGITIDNHILTIDEMVNELCQLR